MMEGRKLLLLVALTAMSACAGPRIALTGKTSVPIPKESVQVYLNSRPSCRFEEVGLLEVKEAWGLESLLDGFKTKAAEVGADGVDVSQIDKNPLGVYRGTAVAIRCMQSN